MGDVMAEPVRYAPAAGAGASERRRRAPLCLVVTGHRGTGRDTIAAALRDIVERADDGETVVVVTHGMAARIGSVFFAGGNFADTRLLGGVRNCAWIVLDPGRDAVWRIRQYNVQA